MMLWPIGLILGLLAMGASRRSSSAAPTSVPHGSVYNPEQGRIVTPDGRQLEVPNADAPPSSEPPRALVPYTPPAPPPPVPLQPPPGSTRPAAPPARPAAPAAPTGPAAPVKQPPGTTGNLPNITRPLGRAGFNPEKAHQLAPAVLASIRNGPVMFSKADKARLIDFQKAADLDPADGIYGPRTAGAVEFYASQSGQPAKAPPPWTKDKRVIPYAI